MRQRDVTSNTYCDLATQTALFRAASDPPKPAVFRATHTVGRKTTQVAQRFGFCITSGSVEA